MNHNIQYTVIIYKGKTYISRIAAMILMKGDSHPAETILFDDIVLIEIKDQDKLKGCPVYNLDVALASFVKPGSIKGYDIIKADKKNVFTFDGMTFIPLFKLDAKQKYYLRHKLPAVKIFGKYFILCDAQKDVNTNTIVATSR